MERRGKWGRRNNSKVSTTKGEETEFAYRRERKQSESKRDKNMRKGTK